MKKVKQGQIVKAKRDNLTILVTGKSIHGIFQGVVIEPDKYSKTGEYSDRWMLSEFKKIKYPKGYYLTRSPIL